MTAQTRIGISGWRYAGWRSAFYPKGLPQKLELSYASRQFNSIEINGTFYSLQHPGTFQRWYDETPDDFMFSVKGPRFVTHIKRLNDVEYPVANFFASGVLQLKKKLGPILWQLPPSFKFDPRKLEAFFKILPTTTTEAARLAKKHDKHIRSDVASENVGPARPLRYAIEVRDESFRTVEFIKLLRKYKMALTFADAPTKWPYMEDITSNFIYLRLHGEKELYSSGYNDKALDKWAMRLRVWRRGGQIKDAAIVSPHKMKKQGRDIFVYFDNDVKVRAPYDASRLLHKLTDFKPAFALKRPRLKSRKIIYGPRVKSPKRSPWRNLGPQSLSSFLHREFFQSVEGEAKLDTFRKLPML